MAHNQKTGELGENIACSYIRKRGYKIIERNHRQKWGEIDIIAKAPDGTLVFFEVKTLSQPVILSNSEEYMTPEMHLTGAKLRKLQRTSSIYANSNEELIDDNRGWRIDLLAIDLNHKIWQSSVRHYENI